MRQLWKQLFPGDLGLLEATDSNICALRSPSSDGLIPRTSELSRLKINSSVHWPVANIANRSNNRCFGMSPPRGGRNKSILGNLDMPVLIVGFRTLDISCNTMRMAAQLAPRTNFGALHHNRPYSEQMGNIHFVQTPEGFPGLLLGSVAGTGMSGTPSKSEWSWRLWCLKCRFSTPFLKPDFLIGGSRHQTPTLQTCSHLTVLCSPGLIEEEREQPCGALQPRHDTPKLQPQRQHRRTLGTLLVPQQISQDLLPVQPTHGPGSTGVASSDSGTNTNLRDGRAGAADTTNGASSSEESTRVKSWVAPPLTADSLPSMMGTVLHLSGGDRWTANQILLEGVQQSLWFFFWRGNETHVVPKSAPYRMQTTLSRLAEKVRGVRRSPVRPSHSVQIPRQDVIVRPHPVD